MPSITPQPAAWLLTLKYDGDQVRFDQKERMTMVVPGSDPTTGFEGQTGYWVELRDAVGAVVYRVVLHDPMPRYMEVHPEGGGHSHSALKERRGSFHVVVPALPGPSKALFYGTDEPVVEPVGDRKSEQARQARPRVGTGPAREMAGVSLEGIEATAPEGTAR